MKRAHTSGFTLVELMIAIVIMAILAAIAYPAYTGFVAQARRSDAHIALTRAAALQEKFFWICSRYTVTLAGTFPGAGACNGAGLGYRVTSPEGHYALAVTPGPTGDIATSFAITATAIGAQATADGGNCTSMTLTSTGAKTAVGSLGAARCWKG